MPYDLADLGRFGVRPEDEHPHPNDPTERSWNESVFYDFVAGPDLAGHVRIGRFEGQGRAWVWGFFYVDGEWLAVEQPRVPLSDLRGFDVESHGLAIVRTVTEPLRVDELSVRAVARVVRGPNAGRLRTVVAALRYEARGPAHSLGPSTMAGHDGGELGASRFEQPMHVRGVVTVDGSEHAFDGTGERDHSWGPRQWNMEWTFLVAHCEAYRLQCARVVFDPDTYLAMGYFGTDRTVPVVDFDPELERTDDLDAPYRGRIRFSTEEGVDFGAVLEPLAACEIDASHAFDPPTSSHYVRVLVRLVPDDGSEPAYGWLEVNRFANGIPGADA